MRGQVSCRSVHRTAWFGIGRHRHDAARGPQPQGAGVRGIRRRPLPHRDRTRLQRRRGAGVLPHDLRHRRATLWHLSRVPVAEASVWLGHSAAEQLKTYAHVVLDRTEIDIPELLKASPTLTACSPRVPPHPEIARLAGVFRSRMGTFEEPQARSQGGLAASRRRSCVSTPGHTVERRGLGCGPGVRPLGTAAASAPASPHPSDRASTPVEFLAEPIAGGPALSSARMGVSKSAATSTSERRRRRRSSAENLAVVQVDHSNDGKSHERTRRYPPSSSRVTRLMDRPRHGRMLLGAVARPAVVSGSNELTQLVQSCRKSTVVGREALECPVDCFRLPIRDHGP